LRPPDIDLREIGTRVTALLAIVRTGDIEVTERNAELLIARPIAHRAVVACNAASVDEIELLGERLVDYRPAIPGIHCEPSDGLVVVTAFESDRRTDHVARFVAEIVFGVRRGRKGDRRQEGHAQCAEEGAG